MNYLTYKVNLNFNIKMFKTNEKHAAPIFTYQVANRETLAILHENYHDLFGRKFFEIMHAAPKYRKLIVCRSRCVLCVFHGDGYETWMLDLNRTRYHNNRRRIYVVLVLMAFIIQNLFLLYKNVDYW